MTKGTRAQVMHGTADSTGYGKSGLKKSDLKYNPEGKIVSKKVSAIAKRKYPGSAIEAMAEATEDYMNSHTKAKKFPSKKSKAGKKVLKEAKQNMKN